MNIYYYYYYHYHYIILTFFIVILIFTLVGSKRKDGQLHPKIIRRTAGSNPESWQATHDRPPPVLMNCCVFEFYFCLVHVGVCHAVTYFCWYDIIEGSSTISFKTIWVTSPTESSFKIVEVFCLSNLRALPFYMFFSLPLGDDMKGNISALV